MENFVYSPLIELSSLYPIAIMIACNAQDAKPFGNGRSTILGADSASYEILFNAAQQIKAVNGLICEVGVREGGGLNVIIEGCKSTQDTNRLFIGIDCYGHLPYQRGEKADGEIISYDKPYPNTMKRLFLRNMYEYCYDNNIDFILFNMTDTQFFQRFANGVPVYNEEESLINQYALVHFDAQHTAKNVIQECMFFIPRSQANSIFVFDDIDLYKHNEVEAILDKNSFKILEKAGKKASYIKL